MKWVNRLLLATVVMTAGHAAYRRIPEDKVVPSRMIGIQKFWIYDRSTAAIEFLDPKTEEISKYEFASPGQSIRWFGDVKPGEPSYVTWNHHSGWSVASHSDIVVHLGRGVEIKFP